MFGRVAFGPDRWKAIGTGAGQLQRGIRWLINRVRQSKDGAALLEYGLLAGLIAVICLGGVTLMGEEISDAFSIYASALAGI